MMLSLLRGLLGIAVLIAIAFVFSENRKKISWRIVLAGLGIQLLIAFLLFNVPLIRNGFEHVSDAVVSLIGYTKFGTEFLFSSFSDGKVHSGLVNFAFQVLPTILFFSALSALLYYWGILQKIVYFFAWIMRTTMRLSGAESLAAAGNIFLGQTEAPLLIRPYLEKMTRSEIMAMMTGGMATIAGGVLASYIGFLGGDDPVQQRIFAKHLLTASVLSAPAALIMAKILIPENETINQDMHINKEKIGTNSLEALANGTSDGLKLAVNVGAMLLVFTALIYLGNGILGWFGGWVGLNEVIAAHTGYSGLSFQFIVGYTCAPIAWLVGVDWNDAVLVGQLIGEKTILNEFYAYVTLADLKGQGLFQSEKSIVIATYVLCGFSNFASIGIQV
ncbi:MAG: Na+ dependent nucleoside transporter, partial [Bacteroidota bacterium]|nr:Na+ dependent nucleoside transporter [Bacteroidota bacterium]MDX5430958.1 Na+ dependent nucleoside transporter [Bacteroidota bacterium]MDX5469709.1 Na+ dependent nucleoside transporter [Bacteroidota bacterium]